ILAVGVTSLLDELLETRTAQASANHIEPERISRLDRHQARDLLLLAAYYDQSTAETFRGRFRRLRKRLKFRSFRASWDFALGIVGSLAAVVLLGWLTASYPETWRAPRGIGALVALAVLAWLPYAVRWLCRTWQAYSV